MLVIHGIAFQRSSVTVGSKDSNCLTKVSPKMLLIVWVVIPGIFTGFPDCYRVFATICEGLLGCQSEMSSMEKLGTAGLKTGPGLVNRRSVLLGALYGGLLAATTVTPVTALASSNLQRASGASKRVIIIGAGIAGLCSAYELE